MILAVKFKDSDPTKGAYDQLPEAVVEILEEDPLPTPGIWVKLTQAELQDYLSRVKLKSEPLFLRPATGHVMTMPPVSIAGLSSEEVNVVRNKIKRLFGTGLCAEIIDELGGRNVSIKKTGSFVLKMSQDLQPAAALLQNGALKTAYSVIVQISPKYPDHLDLFEEVKTEIKDFLDSIGEW